MESKAFNMDCMEGMRQYPDKYFDLAVVDPPYGIGVLSMNYTKSGAVRTRGHSAAKRRDYRKQGEWDVKPPKMTNDFSDCEYAWISNGLGVARMFRYCWNGMIQGDMKNKEERFHPTQKPIALYAWIFSRYAKPGMKILDTHLGSGSSRIAAYDAGLDFVGYEIDKEYFAKQEQRFADYTAQTNLFIDSF